MGDINVPSDSTILYCNPSDQIFNIFIYSYIRMCLNVPFHYKFSMLEHKRKQCISNMAKWREKGLVNIFLQDFTVSSIYVVVPH